ncbi:PDZ domain-containing protein [Candidatus Palauibacter sp.]|uniref:PDZ domain-containing protein n=1 Tax=Candidatus Palauibacter sp. TaxID=3101350 RepID=UPI003B018291
MLTLTGSQSAYGQALGDPREPDPSRGVTGIAYNPFPGGLLLDDKGNSVIVPPSERPYPIIVRIHPCSPAEEAGLLVGDRLVRINGRDARELPTPWHGGKPGAIEEIEVHRGEKLIEVSVARVALAELSTGCPNARSRNRFKRDLSTGSAEASDLWVHRPFGAVIRGLSLARHANLLLG